MVNAVMDAITVKLDSLFPASTIYTEKVEQGSNEPCFIVRSVTTGAQDRIGGGFMQDMAFIVTYLTADGIRDINTTEQALLAHMGTVTMINGNVCRATRRGTSFKQDDMLHFEVSYQLSLRENVPAEEPMNSIIVTGGVANGN